MRPLIVFELKRGKLGTMSHPTLRFLRYVFPFNRTQFPASKCAETLSYRSLTRITVPRVGGQTLEAVVMHNTRLWRSHSLTNLG